MPEIKRSPTGNNILKYILEFPNYLSIFISSFFLMLASPILIEISRFFKTNPGELNLVFAFFTFGLLFGQSTSVFFSLKFKKINILITSYSVLIILVTILFFNRNIILFYVVYFMAGYIIGVISIQANELLLVSEIENKDRLITIAFTFWPIGALVSPITSSFLVNCNADWKYIYVILFFVLLLILILYFVINKFRPYSNALPKTEKIRPREIFVIRKTNIMLILTMLSLIFFALSESIIFSWSPTFFRTERMFDIESAGVLLSLYWIGVITGRLFTSMLAGKVNLNKILFVASTVSIVSVICLFLIEIKNLSFFFMFMTGLGFSGIFPILISNGSKLYEKGKGILLTLLLDSTTFGGAVSPFIIKSVANFNMRLSVYFAIFYIIIVIIFLVTNTFYKKYA
jgi:fucose permease